MAASTIQHLLGEVRAWPSGLLDKLPEGPWAVAHVKPRQEKLLASNLRHYGLPSVLFLEHRVRTYVRQGVQSSEIPLLPGYLFIVADEMDYDIIYSTDRVVRLMTVRDPADLVSDLTDLIALVTRAETPLQVRPELIPGSVVELCAGSMAGLRGVVLRRKGSSELVVNVRMLGTSVAVACDASCIGG
jgi:transcription antitermination factor NusG